MGITTEFDTFEQHLLELIQELQTINLSEHRLREGLRTEASRAEAAEAARDAALRAEAEARSSAAAATAAASHSTAILAKVQDELAATKMQFELAERHRIAIEEKCSELSSQLAELQREVQKLRPLQAIQTNLQRQYTELQERVQNYTNEAKREASRLETEIRRVEKSASGGAEIRDRARLAAAAHVRERRLAAAELQHTSHELHNAKAEVVKLASLVAELQYRLAECTSNSAKSNVDPNEEALVETRAALEAERAGAARLERALAAALADNAAMAARFHAADNATAPPPTSSPPTDGSTNICPINSFLAD